MSRKNISTKSMKKYILEDEDDETDGEGYIKVLDNVR